MAEKLRKDVSLTTERSVSRNPYSLERRYNPVKKKNTGWDILYKGQPIEFIRTRPTALKTVDFYNRVNRWLLNSFGAKQTG